MQDILVTFIGCLIIVSSNHWQPILILRAAAFVSTPAYQSHQTSEHCLLVLVHHLSLEDLLSLAGHLKLCLIFFESFALFILRFIHLDQVRSRIVNLLHWLPMFIIVFVTMSSHTNQVINVATETPNVTYFNKLHVFLFTSEIKFTVLKFINDWNIQLRTGTLIIGRNVNKDKID